MISRVSPSLQRFWRDDRGAVVIDHIPVFFMTIILVLLIFEIGIAYFLNVRSHKAAQIGARVAAVLPPVHSGVPLVNSPATALGPLGEPCFNPNGANRCIDPVGPWVCRGSNLAGACDTALFGQIVSNMRRTFPDLDDGAVTISYIYRALGETGGPFVPEITVNIQPHEYQFAIFGVDSATKKEQLTRHGGTRFSGVTASAFGEDMTPETSVPGG